MAGSSSRRIRGLWERLASRISPAVTRGSIWHTALLVAAVWISDFWRFREFGLYEDDFTFIPQAILKNLGQLAGYIVDYTVHLYGHGRPLSDSLISLFSFIGWRSGGLEAIYIIGFLIVSANVLLFYQLLRRVGGEFFALTGGLAFALFPADTTQPFLTHSLGLQPSLTFFLLATHAYLANRRPAAYALLMGSLLCYETVFPVFLAVPLISGRFDRRKPRELSINAAVMLGMLGGFVILRLLVGESRVAGLEFPVIILTPIRHMFVGPLVTLGTFFLRPVQAAIRADLQTVTLAGVFAVAIFATIGRQQAKAFSSLKAPRIRQLWGELRTLIASLGRNGATPTSSTVPWLQLLIAGTALLVLAYPLTFNIRSFSISGRDTRVHFAAVIGASLIFATLVSVLRQMIRKNLRKRLFDSILALWLAALMGFGLSVQDDYARAWTAQRAFWSDLVELIPDAAEGTVVLVEPSGLRDFEQIDANTWNLPRLLAQIYRFPEDWADAPRVFRLVPGWRERILSGSSTFALVEGSVTAPPSLYGTISTTQVVLIDTSGAALRRVTDKLILGEETVLLSPIGEPFLPIFPPGFLHPLLGTLPGEPGLYLTEG